jgi:hypothetical protein
MINDEPKSMKEIHDIRVKHYQQRKHLSDKEKIALINSRAKEAIEKYGLKFKEYSKI